MRNITDRQAQLLKILSAKNACHTFQSLGDFLGVSARTIARELDACAGYVKKAGLLLVRSTEGICLSGKADAVSALQSALDKKAYVANQAQRLILLKLKLLQQTEPMKLYVLSRELRVAESTISHDLGKASAWFEGYGLRLTRRQGFGIALAGKESDRRGALAGLVYESLSDTILVRWLTGERLLKDHAKEAFLLQWLDVDMAANIAAQLKKLHYEDKHLVALTLHLLIIVSRAKSGYSCERTTEKALRDLPQYLEATELANRLNLRLPEEELSCIAVHLHNRRMTTDDEERRHVLALAQNFLLEVGAESGFAFSYDKELVESVANHLSAALYRLRLQMKIRNPLEKEIKACYAQSFAITRRALAVIERQENLDIPDAEAAFLTMYLLAALETGKPADQKIFHVAVCCPLGMSSGVLLTSRIKSLYKNIVVDHMVSITRLGAMPEVDLILSTVECVCSGTDVITVSPLFTEADQGKLDTWLSVNLPRQRPANVGAAPEWKDKLLQINAFSEALIRFLNHVFFSECAVEDKEAAIRCAAAKARGEAHEAVVEAIRARELKGSVIAPEQNLLLLHARAETIKELHFGVLCPLKAFLEQDVPIQTVVVMLAPLRATRSQIELLQKLTAMIAEDECFQQLLTQCTAPKLQAALENIFQQYFKEKFIG